MEAPGLALPEPGAAAGRLRRLRPNVPALGGWALGFALVGYLSLANGGYETVVRNEVGVAVWWLVLLGAIAGLVPGRLPARAWVAVGLLAALCLWTGLATSWSESEERTVTELGRNATYLGLLVLALAAQARTGARHVLAGVACAIAAVGCLAVLSRLHPAWFPRNDQAEFLGNARRLAYPLNYWNGLAALLAMGVPLLLALAGAARRLAVQSLAAAAVPVLVLGIWLTVSRGGAIALGVGLVAFLLLAADRPARVGTLAVCAIGSAILLAAAHARPLVGDAVRSPAAQDQADELLALVALVAGGVGLLQAAVGLAERHAGRPAWVNPGHRRAAVLSLAALAAAMAVAVAAGAPAALQDTWDEFRAPPGTVAGTSDRDLLERIQSATGRGRYQYWESAVDAQRSDPWRGIGPGTFEFWWARNGTTQGFVRDAHSLYAEVFAELGIVGLVLVGGLLLLLLGVGAARALRAPPALRTLLAGATAAAAVFATSAAYEWVWELAALVAAVIVVGAALLVGGDAEPSAAAPAQREPAPPGGGRRLGRLAPRLVVGALALAALPAVAVPLAGAVALRDSEAAARDGRDGPALSHAAAAERLQPYAAAPWVQRALVAEQAGDVGTARAAIRRAVRLEPTDWRPWLIRARIEARAGDGRSAVRAYRRARDLNPRSAIFAR
jgi:O-Antigen ligase/Tetratricopeptide repeat